eukprot:223780-Chlamydomonas_euryale.AAC.4
MTEVNASVLGTIQSVDLALLPLRLFERIVVRLVEATAVTATASKASTVAAAACVATATAAASVPAIAATAVATAWASARASAPVAPAEQGKNTQIE